ncbi:MAG: hypothetical protein H6740_05390 [Alphaproteobacteria bacterium]|nr:hypothetical protein [Alphaproteobacteria bacterium]
MKVLDWRSSTWKHDGDLRVLLHLLEVVLGEDADLGQRVLPSASAASTPSRRRSIVSSKTLEEQGLLVLEVEVDGAVGHAGLAGDVADPRGVEALLREHRDRGRA